MKSSYTAVIKQSGNWWIGWIEEVPGVNCQEATREELVESLREALREALEFNRKDARDAAGQDFDEESISL
jgi:predicted RNase H-like HicB family nuclease